MSTTSVKTNQMKPFLPPLSYKSMLEEKNPKYKYFGRPPLAPMVKVRCEYEPEPNTLLQSLTEFIYKNAKTMEFGDEQKDYWESIFKAVICTSSYEAQVFKNNLKELIEDNIAETGYDPRIEGPPSHIANQEIKDKAELEAEALEKARLEKLKKEPPHYLTMTKSVSQKSLQERLARGNLPNLLLNRRMYA